MKISIITVVYNNANYVGDCVRSVVSQSYPDIEYIIVDGGSGDGTLEIINSYKKRIAKFISERDKGYVYAMNKGLELSTGEVIGFLQSDDFYAHGGVIEKVASVFKKSYFDSLYADLVYVEKNNPENIIRYWKSGSYNKRKMRWGWMPPHPTFFVKKHVYEKHGYFNTDFRISADYEILLRFLYRHGISSYYIPEVLVKMRWGGVSNRSLRDIARKTSEDCKAWKIYSRSVWPLAVMAKNIRKLPQFFIGKKEIQ